VEHLDVGGFVVHHVKKIMKHLFHDHHILSIKKSTLAASELRPIEAPNGDTKAGNLFYFMT
jgi:hypothetical protein